MTKRREKIKMERIFTTSAHASAPSRRSSQMMQLGVHQFLGRMVGLRLLNA